MRPPVRPPQLRCVFFSSMYLPHLLVLPATFWTSVPFATLSVFPSLICGSCPSGQRFAYSFFQIPSHGGHPCCSAMCFVVAYAHLGLSPIRKRPCWANKKAPARSTILQAGAFSSYFSTLKPAFFYYASCSGFEVSCLLSCGSFSQTWATSFMEKLILPILSLPRQTTVTWSPRVRTSSTRSMRSFAILEM